MDHFAGIDVSLEQSSVCVVDATGRIVREAKVASEPEALITLSEGPQSAAGAHRPGSRASVAVAPGRSGQSRVRGGAAGDQAREGGALGDDRQDRPQGCARHRPAAADGLVPAGPLQVGARPGGSGAAGRAQAVAGQDARRGAQLAGSSARLRAQGGRDQQRAVCGAGAHAGRGSHDAGADRRGDAAGARGAASWSSASCIGPCWRSCGPTRSAGG